MHSRNILEPVNMFNKWSALESSIDDDSIIATSQFFYPVDVCYYVDLIKRTEDSLVATEIWPSGFCNHHCVFCSSDIFEPNSRGMLEANTLKRLISDLSALGNKLVRISGGGEPFMCSGLGSVIELVAEKNMHSLFITNGSLLNDKMINLLAQFASVVRVSLNGGNAKDYFRVHRADHFDRVVNKMQKLASRRAQERREDSLLLGVTFVITPQNFRHVSDAVAIVKSCGFDFIFIRGANPIRHRFIGPDRDLLYEQLQKSHEFKDSNFFVSGSITKLDGARGKKPLHPRCYVSNYRFFINSDGNVFSCFSAIMHKHEPYGNIYQDSIKNIWGNTHHLRTRMRLLKGEFPGFCNRFCDHVEFNACVDWINEKIQKDKNVKFHRITRSWANEFVSEEYKSWF